MLKDEPTVESFADMKLRQLLGTPFVVGQYICMKQKNVLRKRYNSKETPLHRPFSLDGPDVS